MNTYFKVFGLNQYGNQTLSLPRVYNQFQCRVLIDRADWLNMKSRANAAQKFALSSGIFRGILREQNFVCVRVRALYKPVWFILC